MSAAMLPQFGDAISFAGRGQAAGQHRLAYARIFQHVAVRLRERTVRRREFIALLSSAAAIRPLGLHAERPPDRVLYFTFSAGYRHEVIPLSKTILTQLGRNSGVFEVIATEDASEFSPENLKRYAAVVFYTSGELPMSGAEKTALLSFVHRPHFGSRRSYRGRRAPVR
jgi:hypothetical protein